MATIIFKVLGTSEHYKATYKLAQKLKSKTHRVIYIGEQGYKEGIMKQGFEFYNSANFSVTDLPPEGNIITKILFRFRINDKNNEAFFETLLFHEIIKLLKPDLFILDVSLGFIYPVLLKKRTKVLFFSTKVSVNNAYIIPPNISSFGPRCGFWSFLR